jgi:hypothetical protein
MGTAGNILRGFVLAVVLGAGAVIIGGAAALFGCAGGCAFAEGGARFVDEEVAFLAGLPMAFVLGGFLILGLFVSLVPRDPVSVLAALFGIGVALVSFFYFLPDTDPGLDEALRSDPVLPPRPQLQAQAGDVDDGGEARLTAEPALSCPSDSFDLNGGCVPCFVEKTVTAEPRLRFSAVPTEASWVYADRRLVQIDGRELSVDAYLSTLADRTDLCRAEALVVYGSASSDGARPLNEERARARASNLAEAVRAACTGRSSGLVIYALSLGQSEAPSDVPEDRSVSISTIEILTDEEVTADMVLEELSYAVGEGQEVAPILTRRERFPRPWTGPLGTNSSFRAADRPMRTAEVLAPGAPASCRTNGASGLDAGPALRQ